MNEAKIQKAERERQEKELRDEKERARKERDEHVKKVIKDTNFGGRALPT